MARIYAIRACNITDVSPACNATSISNKSTYRKSIAGTSSDTTAALTVFSSIASRQSEGLAPHGDLLHQVPGVVVFTAFACPFPCSVATRAGCSSPASAAPSSTGPACRRDKVWRMRAVPRDDRERNCISVRVRVLLQMCVRVRARAWPVSCNVGTSASVATTKDFGVNMKNMKRNMKE